MIIWVELGLSAAGVLLLPYVGRWTMAGCAALGALVCLLMAGSLRVTGFILRRAAEGGWLDEDAAPEGGGSEGGGAEAAKRFGLSLDELPGRTGSLVDLALYFLGVAAVLLALPPHAAACGWAGSAAGLAAAHFLHSRRWAKLLVFMGSSAAASVLALLWVPPESALQVVRTASAIAVMSAGAAASGTSVLALRLRVSPKAALPASMGLAAWSLAWFFARGEEFGHEPLIVAWGVGIGAALAGIGYLLGALDGAAAGVVLFFVSRVYGFLDWPGTLPLVAAVALAWRPRKWWLEREPGEADASHRHLPLQQIAAGVLPLALAGAFFTFKVPVLLSVYLAACGAAVAVEMDALLKRWSRLRIVASAGCAILACIVPAVLGDHAGLGGRSIGIGMAGALSGWLAAESLRLRAPGWRELRPAFRGALMGGVAAVVAVCVATMVIVKDGMVI